MNKKVVCPYCNHHFKISKQSKNRRCPNCRVCFENKRNIINWLQKDSIHLETKETEIHRSIVSKIRHALKEGDFFSRLKIKLSNLYNSYFSPYAIITMPLRNKAKRLSEDYFNYILSANDISKLWYERYFRNCKPLKGSSVLEIGCGRGRNLCHLNNAGHRVHGLDVYKDPWWDKLDVETFNVVPQESTVLPYPDNSFDAIISFQVAGFFSEERLKKQSTEIYRILKPSGLFIMQETNSGSYGIKYHKAYYGRIPHSLKDAKKIFSRKFTQIDSWYEGYYSKKFTLITSLWKATRGDKVGTWMMDEKDADRLPAERRGLWILRLRKD